MTVTQYAIANSGDDGHVTKTSNTYPPAGTIAVDTTASLHPIQRSLSGANYTVRVLLLAFDTSSGIGSDDISAATLELYISATNFNNTDTRNLVGEWYTASYTGSIVSGDYTATPASSAFSVALSSLTTNAVNTITLTSPDSNIAKSGVTALRIHVDGGQPTGLNRVNIASVDDPSNQEPRLNVTHAAAAAGQPMSLRRRFFLTGAQRIARGS